MEQSEKNNRLIADFMGLNVEGKYCEHHPDPYPSIIFADHGDLMFNESWGWLMPVVEKIEHLVDEGILGSIDFKIGSGEIRVRANNHLIYLNNGYTEDDSKIEAVYHAVVEFIKWYNKNVKPKIN